MSPAATVVALSPMKAALDDADIDFHDVPGQDPAWAADAVNDLLVDGNAGLPGKPAITEKRALQSFSRISSAAR
jgi:hypothetical protein